MLDGQRIPQDWSNMKIVISSKNKELVNTQDTYRPGTETVMINLEMKLEKYPYIKAERKVTVTLKDPCF